MATFGDVLREIQDKSYERQREGVSDPVRRKYLEALHRLTGRTSSYIIRPSCNDRGLSIFSAPRLTMKTSTGLWRPLQVWTLIAASI